jgi:outer membrane protein OmpA-like peptidoglycan-associated protein
MKRKTLSLVALLIMMAIIATVTGCGASKEYVDKSVADERARNQATVGQLQSDVSTNKADIERVQSLVAQLEQKTAKAVNEAKGFENYQVLWEGEIFFAFNSTEIRPDAQQVLDEGAKKMTENKNSVMEISGYTDPTGSSAYNLELGNKRATAAKYYLVDAYGINLFRIFMVSYGDKKSVAMADGKISYGKQRRVQLKLWGPPPTQ